MSIIKGLVDKKRTEHPECVVICNNGEKFLFGVWYLGWEDSEAGLPTEYLPLLLYLRAWHLRAHVSWGIVKLHCFF